MKQLSMNLDIMLTTDSVVTCVGVDGQGPCQSFASKPIIFLCSSLNRSLKWLILLDKLKEQSLLVF